MVEVVDVAAHIKDHEVFFVIPWPVQVWAKPGASSHHLPELCLGMHRLEEEQINDIGNVNAGVEHVDGNGDLEAIIGEGKIVDEALHVGQPTHDHASEMPRVLGIVRIESSADEVRMFL